MSDLPSLPSFLTSPLTCPPIRCNHLKLPPQSIPADLSRSLREIYVDSLHTEIWKSCLNMSGRPSVTDVISKLLLEIPLRQRSLKAFVGSVAEGGSELARLEAEVATITLEFMAEGGEGGSRLLETVFQSFLPTLSSVLDTAVGASRTACLHDLLRPGFDIRKSETLIRSRRLKTINTFSRPVDSTALLLQFESMIASRVIRGKGWSSRDDWRSQVRKIHERMRLLACRAMYEALVRSGGPLDGYKELADCPDFVLRLFAYINSAEVYSTSLDKFLQALPEAFGLIDIARLSTTARRSLLEGCHPLSNEIPSNALSPLRRPAASVPTFPLHKSPRTPFDRFQQLPNSSDRYPHVPIFPLPRCCPPDRCSGAKPPSAEAYEMIDRQIRFLFNTVLDSFVAQTCLSNMVRQRDCLLDLVADHLQTFGLSDENDRILNRLLDAPNYLVHVINRDSHDDILNSALSPLRMFTKQLKANCLCDLASHRDHLEQLAGRTSVSLASTVPTKRQIKDSLPAIDTEAVVADLEGQLRLGGRSGECWRGDWQSGFREWLTRATAQIEARMTDLQGMAQYQALLRTRSSVLGSAVLLEIVWGEESDKELYLLLKDFVFDSGAASHGAQTSSVLRGQANSMVSSNPVESTRLYVRSCGFDASNWQASLNAAAVRLQLANDSDQSFQWSRAISDCTFSLYYGGPSFKAYYRRGFALAHLKMYKKAIADFEQALLLEPKNPVALLHLALARKNKHA